MIMPILQTYSFENLVHSIVWRVGRNFGFQAFNQNPATADRVRCKLPMCRKCTQRHGV